MVIQRMLGPSREQKLWRVHGFPRGLPAKQTDLSENLYRRRIPGCDSCYCPWAAFLRWWCVSRRAGFTPWRTCVSFCCRTVKQIFIQQTTSLYLLYCTTTIFLLHLGMPVHKGQNGDNQSGLSFFEQKIVRFWFLGHQHWRISPWAAL